MTGRSRSCSTRHLADIVTSSLPATLRTEAASIWTLIRNMGSSIGVSMGIAELTSGGTAMHARLAELVTPFNAGFQLSPNELAARSA